MGAPEEVSGAFTEESAFDLSLACRESRLWIEAVLQERFSEVDTTCGFNDALRNGQRLCRFANCIQPHAIKKINRGTAAFSCMENIASFLDVCRSVGLRDTQLFVAADLYGAVSQATLEEKRGDAPRNDEEEKTRNRRLRDVCITMYWLGRAVREKKDYHGPHLNLAAFTRLMCARCKEGVRDGTSPVSNSAIFHPECYYCDVCGSKRPSADKDLLWNPKTETLSCKDCRCSKCDAELTRCQMEKACGEEKLCATCEAARRCGLCGAPTNQNSSVMVDGMQLCQRCVCAAPGCCRPLAKSQVGPDNVAKYCSECQCSRTGCTQWVGYQPIVCNGKAYCRRCVCADPDCGQPLVESHFTEIDGARFCPDCMCSNPSCRAVAGKNGITVKGQNYCRDCVCAVPTCRALLMCGQGTEVASLSGRVCRDCLCSVCGALANPDGFVYDNIRFCRDCCCAACKTPLESHEQKSIAGENAKAKKKYCERCRCHGCQTSLKPTQARTFFQNQPYCDSCVCVLCRKALAGQRAARGITTTPHGNVCAMCTCTACKAAVKPGQQVTYSGEMYCNECVCATCSKPGTNERGGPLVNAAGLKYCRRCVCYQCQAPLMGSKGEYKGNNYCQNCICSNCGTAVPSSLGVTAQGSTYCPQCVCSVCRAPAPYSSRCEYGDLVLCCRCACSRCGSPVNTKATPSPSSSSSHESLSAFAQQKFCERCLCRKCRTPLSSSQHDSCPRCSCRACGCWLADGEESLCQDCRVPHVSSHSISPPAQPMAMGGERANHLTQATNTGPRQATNTQAKNHSAGQRVQSPKAAKSPLNRPFTMGNDLCARCHLRLDGAIVTALKGRYHAKCFVCSRCQCRLHSEFMQHEGQPYCAQCVGKAMGLPLCGACGETVSGTYVMFGPQQAWHKRCMKCAQCRTSLSNSDECRLDHGQPVCLHCY